MVENQPEVIIYCDGAAHPNPNGTGGYAAVIMFKGQSKEISGAIANTTNNRMEMTAALAALQVLTKPCKVILRSDSQYLCNAFNKKWLEKWKKNGWKNSQKEPVVNQDLWELLIVQNSRHQVTWEWVKGHSDDEYNNRCDVLAVSARKQYDLDHPKEKK